MGKLKVYFFVGFVFLAFGCEIIGLGKRIDLFPPKCSFVQYGDGAKIYSGDYVKGVVNLGGTCSDDIGVISVKISVGNQDNFIDTVLSEDKKSWSWDFDTKKYPDGEVELFIRAYDAVAKESETKILLIVDNTPPIIVIYYADGYGETPATNSKISIKGEAADNFRIKSIEIKTNTDKIELNSLNGTFSWTSILTAFLSGKYDISIFAFDYAGNKSDVIFHKLDIIEKNNSRELTGSEIYTLWTVGSIPTETVNREILLTLKKEKLPITINLDDDIPKITLSGFDVSDGAINSLGVGAALMGKIFDDDGVNTNSLQITFSDPDDLSTWTPVPKEKIIGSGQIVNFFTDFPVSLADGNIHTMYMSVLDIYGVKGRVGPVQFRINASAPNIQLTSHNSGDAVNSSSIVLSGIISDDIEPLKLECFVDGVKKADGVLTEIVDKKKKNFSCSLTGLTEGSRVIQLKGGDGENQTSFNLSLIVDTELPKVKFISPVSNSFVNGLVEVKGTITDNYLLKESYIMFGKAGGLGVWKKLDQTSSFSVQIDARMYDNNNYSYHDNPVSSVWRLPVLVKAVDLAGNEIVTTESQYFLRIDNMLDRPSVTIINPKNNDVLGGSVRIVGTSFDDEEVYGIYMRIDINGDGSYDRKIDLNKNGTTTTPYTEKGGYKIANNNDNIFEDETLWYVVQGNKSSWEIELNKTGEFYSVEAGHKGVINISVVAQDTKDNGLTGDVFGDEASIKITMDDTIPYADNIIPSDKFPIRKTVNFQADFFDKIGGGGVGEGIKNIEVSFNNGASYTSFVNGETVRPEITTITDTNFDHRRLNLSIDTTDTTTYPLVKGQLYIKLKVVDVANYMSITTFIYNVDNTFPEGNLISATDNQYGNSVKIQGTAVDTGDIRGVKSVYLYFTTKDGSTFINPKNGTQKISSVGNVMSLKNGSGLEENLIYPSDESYIIKIDNTKEDGQDTKPGYGDSDGFNESLSLDGSTYNWWVNFDATANFSDGEYKIHYVIFDNANNGTYYNKPAFITNNRPVLVNFSVGTDINGDTSVNNTLSDLIEIENYDSQNLIIARNNRAYIKFYMRKGNYTAISDMDISIARDGISENLVTDKIIKTMDFGSGAENVVEVTALIDTATFTAGETNFICSVVDKVGINASVTIKLDIQNSDSVSPQFNLLPNGISDRKNISGFPLYPAEDNLSWQYLVPGESESSDSWIKINPSVSPTVIGHYDLVGTSDNISGSIIWTGKAYDNRRIQKIYFCIDANNNSTFEAGEKTEIAGVDLNGFLESKVAGCQILSQNRFKQTLKQKEGHTVYFNYTWDASAIEPKDNLKVAFIVEDFGSSSAQSDKNINIKPYITSIRTDLSTVVASNPSIFSRTALGEYSVRAGEIIKIRGMNFGSAPTLKINGNSVTTTFTAGEIVATIAPTVQSGDILVTANGIDSTNNTNDITKLCNREPNRVNNDVLTNRRKLKIWDFNLVASTGLARFPSMAVTTTGTPIFAFANGTQYFSVATVGNPTPVKNWEMSYTQYYVTAIALDTSNFVYAVTQNGDVATTKCGPASLFAWDGTASNVSQYSATSTNKCMFESIWNGTYINSERLRSPSIKVLGAKGSADVFLCYYDESNKIIKYRYGSVTGSTQTFGGAFTGNCDLGVSASTNTTLSGFSTVADTAESGSYTSLAVNSAGTRVVVFWYDSNARALKYKVTNNPKATTPTWGSTQILDEEYAGQYVSAIFDSSDNIHVAYYTSAVGDLKYAKLTWNGATSSYNHDVKVVDSYLSVGLNISIVVIADKPYIGYYNGSYTSTNRSVKLAYQKDATLADGAANDKFTGAWEVATLPTSNIPKNFNVSVGNRGGKPVVGYATDAGIEWCFAR